MNLLKNMLDGEPQALARAISVVEAGGGEARSLLQSVYDRAGRATVIGITGPPGVGKSTLVSGLIGVYRRRKRRVAILAVDPSSAFSGGALLGDRIRMQAHALDPEVYIRSMASRGHAGGLARATADAVDLADASGWDPILIETLGVGQDEVEVAMLADPVLVVLMPGMGDDIQAIKAGLIEIADLLVINKADLSGAESLERDLRSGTQVSHESAEPVPPILRTVAARGEGLDLLVDEVESYRRGTANRRDRLRKRCEQRLLTNLRDRVVREFLDRARADGQWDDIVRDLMNRRTDPYTAADRVWGAIRGTGGGNPTGPEKGGTR